MSNLQLKIKNTADDLRDHFQSFIFDEYISGNENLLKNINVRQVDNDLGYISITALDEENIEVLMSYNNLLARYRKEFLDTL